MLAMPVVECCCIGRSITTIAHAIVITPLEDLGALLHQVAPGHVTALADELRSNSDLGGGIERAVNVRQLQPPLLVQGKLLPEKTLEICCQR